VNGRSGAPFDEETVDRMLREEEGGRKSDYAAADNEDRDVLGLGHGGDGRGGFYSLRMGLSWNVRPDSRSENTGAPELLVLLYARCLQLLHRSAEGWRRVH
jgi:hypothetical protein